MYIHTLHMATQACALAHQSWIVSKVWLSWVATFVPPPRALSKDLYQVQETWTFFFLTYIQFCVPTPIFRMSKVLSLLFPFIYMLLCSLFLLIKTISFMILIYKFLSSLTRTNILFLDWKQGSPTFSDVGNFLNISLKIVMGISWGN